MPNKKLPADPREAYDYLLRRFLRPRKPYGAPESRNRILGLIMFAEHNGIPFGPVMQGLIGDMRGFYNKPNVEEVAVVPTPTAETPNVVPTTVAVGGTIKDEFDFGDD